MLISDAEIQAFQPRGKIYKVFFGDGLYLAVSPIGSKYWRLKYRLNKKEQTYCIGVYPDVSISDAQKAAMEAKRNIRKGENPAAIRRQEEKEAQKRLTKPPSDKTFALSLANNGSITIETETKLVTLTPDQTEALRRFLVVGPLVHKENVQC